MEASAILLDLPLFYLKAAHHLNALRINNTPNCHVPIVLENDRHTHLSAFKAANQI
jgi:hypothetical protein